MKEKLILLTICLVLSCLVLLSQTASPVLALLSDSLSSADSLLVKTDSLFYSADSIYYHQATEEIFLYGNTSVTYQNSSIAADSLHLDLNSERAYSHGPTVMQDADQILLGTGVSYDIESQEGILKDGRSKLDKGFYFGAEVRKVGADTYDVDNGSFTTCDDVDPCFWFSSSKMRIYRSDKIVGKPVIAYVNKFPVFYFPFVTIPLRRGRHSGFLIPEPGYNTVDGKYVKDIAWYYPYKDYADVVLALDLKEKTGWKLNLETDYTKRYFFSGSFNASYNHSVADELETNDWSVQALHHQELGNKATLDANIDFITNKRIWESSGDIDESLAQRVSSSVSYRQPLLSSYLNVGATYTQDLINDRVYLSLPSASFSIPTRPVYELFYKTDRAVDNWWSNLAWNYSVRLDHTGLVNDPDPSLQDLLWANRIDPDDSTLVLAEHHAGINHRLGLSYNWKALGWLNLRQGVDYNENWFDRDKNGKEFVRAADYNAYFNSSFNLYGLKNYNGYIRSVRHIMTPSAGISLSPDFTDNDIYYSFGGIGVSSAEKNANLSLGLDHKWQLKYGKGDIKQAKKINDIFALSSRVNANLFKDDKKFGVIGHSLAFRPGAITIGDLKLNQHGFSLKGLKLSYSATYTMNQDPYKVSLLDPFLRNHRLFQTVTLGGTAPYTTYFPRIKNDLFSAYLDPDSLVTVPEQLENAADSWSLSLTHDFFGPKLPWEPTVHNLRLSAAFKLSQNWGIAYNNYYNIESKELISQSFRLTRDLHCWKLDISYNRRADYWDYRVVLFNTALPDALRFQTRDSKRY